MASYSSRRSSPQKQISEGLSVIPAATTDVVAEDAVVFQIVVVNISGAAATVTVQDKAAAPKTLIPGVTVAANTTFIAAYPEGVRMTGGLTWESNAADVLHGEVFGFYKGQ